MDPDNFSNRTGPRNRHPDILVPVIGGEDELPRAPSPPTSSPTLCAICLSIPPFSPKAILVHPCRHEFCLKCIQGWIKVQRQRASVQASKCPVCRGVIQKIVEKNGKVVEDLTDEVPDEKEKRRRELVRAAAEHRRVQAWASWSDGMWFW